MNRKQIIREYNDMLKHEQIRGEVEPNKINAYNCKCGHKTITIDVDKGVTPFYHICEVCGRLATSSFYRVESNTLKPTEEWYRPSIEETLKMNDGMLQHILSGGLRAMRTAPDQRRQSGTDRPGEK